MSPPTQRRRPVLTQEDLDEIEKRWKKTACNRGLSDADAVFLRNLRTDAESVKRMVWKAFVGLIGLGLLALAAFGLLVQASKLIGKVAP